MVRRYLQAQGNTSIYIDETEILDSMPVKLWRRISSFIIGKLLPYTSSSKKNRVEYGVGNFDSGNVEDI
jgi:hypothetical protein